MQWLRARVAGVAAGWIAIHIGLLLSVPTTLCSTESRAPSVTVACKCPHPAGQTCPMHHARPTADRGGARLCVCASADPLLATIASLLGPVAVLTTSSPVIAAPVVSAWNTAAATPFLDLSARPDSPPPRV